MKVEKSNGWKLASQARNKVQTSDWWQFITQVIYQS